jgi:hypothetical protein
MVLEFVKNGEITGFSTVVKLFVLALLFSSFWSKNLKVKYCFFVTSRNSYLF